MCHSPTISIRGRMGRRWRCKMWSARTRIYLEQVAGKESICNLRRAMDSCLTEQEQLVIRLRYGLGTEEPLRQREVADRTGISRSYVSRIEKRALGKLRAALE